MKFYGTSSIKKKLTAIIMLTSGCALLVACLAFIVYDSITFKNAMLLDLRTVAEIAGLNSTAAITFNRADDANETLKALKAERSIIAAYIFTESGELFAQYFREKSVVQDPPPVPSELDHHFSENRLALFHPITLHDESIGTIYIESDLTELAARLKRYALMVLVVLGISAFVALLLAARFQRIISGPILDLAKTAKVVSDNGDFSVRAVKRSQDELGFLTERFNEMLTQIEERETALQHTRDELQEKAQQLQNELLARKKVDRDLRKSEERFRDLFDHAPDMYIILDSGGIIKDFNEWGLHALGYEREDVIDKPLVQIVHRGDLVKAGKLVSTIHRTRRPPKNTELRLLHKNGQEVWVSEEFSLAKNVDGDVQSIRLVCRDITERKQLQKELGRAQRLEAAGQMAGQIAHDFNNLLSPLSSYPDLIRQDLSEDHPLIELVDEMSVAAKKIADINQQLLAMGRRGHYTLEPIDLNELLENVVMSQPLSKELEVVHDFAPDLLMMKGGMAQLVRVLTNLIINADDAVSGRGVLRITTSNIYLDQPLRGYQTVERGEYIKLEISDTGYGIEAEHMDKIFDPFFTTKTTDRMRGSGLGLSVVHGVMTDHKGYTTVDSTPGQGTTFTLYFPVSREIEYEKAEKKEKVRGGSETILIVDDDPMQLRVTSQLLGRLGYRIHTVASGEQAVDYVVKDPQDLLILDMVMDGIDGTETYLRILQIKPEQKAIVLSGYARSKRVEKALELGAGCFVPKPVSLDALALAVRTELDKV